MKKIIHGLLALSTVASSGLFADVANKTFMAERGALSNNCLMSMSAGAMKNAKKDAIGADLSVTGFFRQSYNDKKLAKYFGGGTNAVPTGNIELQATATAATTALHGNDIDVQADANISKTMSGTVTLSPRRTEVGAQVAWHQNLNKFVDGLWLCVAAPVTYVRTEMRAGYAGQVANFNAVGATASLGKNLSDFFTGADLAKTSPVVQDALANQILTASYNTVTGVADVKAVVGYTFVKEKDYSFGASVHGTIPTGNDRAGVVAFEPTYGHKSFFFGAGLNGEFNLWRSEDGKSELNVTACGKYSYGFSAQQVRTLGLTNVTNGDQAQGHYKLVAKLGTTHAAPLANVSTLAVTVEPRSRLEAVAGFCYRFNRFTADVAYNLFYAQEENVKLKGAFSETAYQLPDPTGVTATTTFADATQTTGGYILAPTSTIVTNAIDLTAPTTPVQVVHKVAAGLGYSFDFSIPVRAGIGGEVDFSSNNQSINSWAAWAKLGFSF